MNNNFAQKSVFSGRVNRLILSQTLNILATKNYDTAHTFFLCPFEITLGATLTTETGRKGLNSVPKDYSQVQLALTSKDTVSVAWKDAFVISQNKAKTNFYKKAQIGQNFLAFPNTENVSGIQTKDQADVISLSGQKNIQCFVPKLPGGQNDQFFTNLEKDEFYFGMIPQFGNIILDYEQVTNLNFFRVQEYHYARDSQKNIIGVEIVLIAINQDFIDNRLTIENYIQSSLPGEPKILPTVIQKIEGEENLGFEVRIDSKHLHYVPVTHIQHTIRELCGGMGAIVMGSTIYQDDVKTLAKEQKITYHGFGALGIYDLYLPSNDPVFLNKPPETDYYVVPSELELVTSLDMIRDLHNGTTSTFRPNPVNGFISTTPNDVHLSNDNNNFLPFGNKNFLTNSAFGKTLGTADVRGNDGFQYRIQEKGKIVGIKTFNGNKVVNKNLVHFLMFNPIILKTIDTLPAININNLGILSKTVNLIVNQLFNGFLKMLTFGLGPDWRDPNISSIPKLPLINFLMPAAVYDDYLNIFKRSGLGDAFTRGSGQLYGLATKVVGAYNPFKDQSVAPGKIPFQVFAKNQQDDLTQFFGTKSAVQAFGGSLTNKILTTCYKVSDPAVSAQFKVTTTDIAQRITINKEEGVPLYDEKTELLAPDIVLDKYDQAPTAKPVGHMILVNSYKLLGGAAVQLKTYSAIGQIALDDKFSNYIDEFRTVSLYRDNPRQINNIHRLGSPLNKNIEFRYPKDLLPVPPASGPYVIHYNDIIFTLSKNDFEPKDLFYDRLKAAKVDSHVEKIESTNNVGPFKKFYVSSDGVNPAFHFNDVFKKKNTIISGVTSSDSVPIEIKYDLKISSPKTQFGGAVRKKNYKNLNLIVRQLGNVIYNQHPKTDVEGTYSYPENFFTPFRTRGAKYFDFSDKNFVLGQRYYSTDFDIKLPEREVVFKQDGNFGFMNYYLGLNSQDFSYLNTDAKVLFEFSADKSKIIPQYLAFIFNNGVKFFGNRRFRISRITQNNSGFGYSVPGDAEEKLPLPQPLIDLGMSLEFPITIEIKNFSITYKRKV